MTARKRTKADHNTPEMVLNYVRAFDRIFLDPCSNPWSTVGADRSWDLFFEQDGLELSWAFACGYLVFCNPPYDNLMPWVEKCILEAEEGCEIILLVPADPSTMWAQRALSMADAVCWPGRRIAFVGAGGNGAKQPSALYYWGGKVKRFCRVFGRMGTVQQLAKYDGGACA